MLSARACIDGVLVPADEARLPVTDDGLIRGDGVFEVIRLYDGRPFALDEHLARMERSAAGLRLPLDVDGVRHDIELLLSVCAEGDELLRVMATRGGLRIGLLEAITERVLEPSLGFVTYAPPRVLDGIKSLSYAANMLAARLAQERGFDDALLVSPHGRVLECPTASFFAVIEGVPRTPPVTDHVLDSITRRVVLEVSDAREEPISLADLDRADEAFVAGTVTEITAVARIEDRTLDAPGPRTREIAGLVRAHIDARLAA